MAPSCPCALSKEPFSSAWEPSRARTIPSPARFSTRRTNLGSHFMRYVPCAFLVTLGYWLWVVGCMGVTGRVAHSHSTQVFHFTDQCKKCKEDHIYECKHNMRFRPTHQDPVRTKHVLALMGDAETGRQELQGQIRMHGYPAFCRNQTKTITTVVNSPPISGPIIVGVDPTGAGNSDLGLCAGFRHGAFVYVSPPLLTAATTRRHSHSHSSCTHICQNKQRESLHWKLGVTDGSQRASQKGQQGVTQVWPSRKKEHAVPRKVRYSIE